MIEQLELFDLGDISRREDTLTRLKGETYKKSHCWQYEIRLRNRQQDLLHAGLTENYVTSLTVADFRFTIVENPTERKQLAAFIKRHEWLGNLSQFTTHWFAAYHSDILAGVLLFNMPNAFSKMLGDNTPELERLISRGACISWSPKNLASNFVMWSIRWMVENTQYRLFTAYSDPMAKELGTIYQACNFYYLGQNAGATKRYVNPYNGNIVSDRYFRLRSQYQRYAKELGYEWQPDWCSNTQMLWSNIPDHIELQLREQSRLKQAEAEQVPTIPKHKYAMVLGANRKETAELRKLFLSINQTRPYPKLRN